jgi:hypothetical protein
MLNFINCPESVLQKNYQIQALLKSGEAQMLDRDKDRVLLFKSP